MPAEPPAGYVVVARAPFVNHVGPIWQWADNAPGEMRLGLMVASMHANSFGYMHGGMIATMVDSAMARALQARLERRSLTLKMSLEYLDAVRVGEMLEVFARLVSWDDDLAQTDCRVEAAGALKARGSGLFRLLRKS